MTWPLPVVLLSNEGGGAAAAHKHLPDRLVILVFKVINRGAQLAAQRRQDGFQVRLHFRRHADLDALGLGAVVDEDAVAQDGEGQRLDVLLRNV